jgi:hypothetical protein
MRRIMIIPAGILIAKMLLHPRFSVSIPPTKGPTEEPAYTQAMFIPRRGLARRPEKRGYNREGVDGDHSAGYTLNGTADD